MGEYHLAQINVARMIGVAIDDPIMKEFVDNLDTVNAVAEESDGFVWRLKDESNNATGLNPYNDEQVIINISVWEDVKSLEKFVYKSFHANFLRRRKEWFQHFGKAYIAMWWVPRGQVPTVEEAVERLDYLKANGSSAYSFELRNPFSPPPPACTD